MCGPEGRRRDDAGFTLLEVVIALVVLTLGALGLAATTVNVVRQGLMADLKTERVAARRAVIEKIHASPYDSVSAGTETVGRYDISWSVRHETSVLKELAVVTVGPAVVTDAVTGPGAIRPDVADTLTYRILKR